MATKKSTSKTKSSDNDSIECTSCGRVLSIEKNYYVSYSKLNRARGRMHICKNCILSMCKELVEESDDIKIGIYRLCRFIDIPYLDSVYSGALGESNYDETASIGENGVNVFKKYIKTINSLGQYKGFTFENGDSLDDEKKRAIAEEKVEQTLTDIDKANRDKVLKDLGYDPFEYEEPDDRKFMFNMIADMLNDRTLEDGILLNSIIGIVRSFNQIRKMDIAISLLQKDIKNIVKNNGNIKSLIDAKEKLNKTTLKLAEDNGLSTKFSTTKAKGSGTISGILQKLMDIGFDNVKVNLFDIQTCDAIKQVADISCKAWADQVNLTESDYADMIKETREEYIKYREKCEELEEKIRLLQVRLNENGIDYEI